MKKRVINQTILLLIIGLVITLLFLLLAGIGSGWLGFINAASMVGLIYLAIGGAMLVVYGGFFRGISYSFRNFFKSKGELYADELSQKQDEFHRPNQKKKLMGPEKDERDTKQPPLTWAFVINGCVFFLVSLIFAYSLY